jgi:maltose O-acetyltransferase
MRYELILWFNHLLKHIPGKIGCKVRGFFLPFKKGKNVKIWDNVQIDSPSKLTLGNNVSINRGCILHAGGYLNIGNDVLIGPNVVIYSQNHCFNDMSRPIRSQGYITKEVNIGNNVWIAANCIILPGVTIGNNVVIGAGAIVTKDVNSNVILYGNNQKELYKEE